MKSNSYEELKRAKNGDVEAKNRITEANIPLVWSLVHRFKSSTNDREDLFQIGCLGLLKAIDKFDTSYNVQFSTYAVPLILGEIKKHFRDDGVVKVSRGLKELNYRINQAREFFQQRDGKDPSIDVLVEYLHADKEDVLMAIDAAYYPTSLNETVFEKDGSKINLEERLYSDDSAKITNLLALQDGIEALDREDKLLLYLRYYCDLNQEAIAERFNVSQVQISRLEKKIIEKIRKQFV